MKNKIILTFLFVVVNSTLILAQSAGKLYLTSAGSGHVYDITGATPSTVQTTLPAPITTPAYYNANNAGDVSNLAVGYDATQASQPLIFINSNTAGNSPVLKNGVASGNVIPNITNGIGGLGTNNVLGNNFGQVFGFNGKFLYRIYPTASAAIPITGDAIWNANGDGTTGNPVSTIFASDTFYDYQNNVYTILQHQNGTVYNRYLYKIAINGAVTSATATQVALITGPVGVRNATTNTSTQNDVGNVRGTAYLNGFVFTASGNGTNEALIYRVNISTGASTYLSTLTGTGFGTGNIDLASVDYFVPFTFNCGGIALQGNTPYVAGTASTRTLRIPVSDIYGPGNYVINVIGTGFTNPAYSATVSTSTTFIDVPLQYTGAGQGGYRTVTVDLNGSTTTCSYNVFIDADTDGDGVLDSSDLDDDNDGILDSAEGCAPTVTMASVSNATATSLANSNSAIVPLVPPGTTLPNGGVTLTKTSGTGNTWGVFSPGGATATTTMTVNGTQTTPFSTTYLDLTGTIPRTLNINFGVSANSMSSTNNQYQYVIGIAGLGGEGTSVTNTFSVPLTVASNANVFGSNLYSLLDGVVSTTPGASGTVFSTNTPLNTAQGYTFFLVPADIASLNMVWTGQNDPHGIIFGVYNANCTLDTDADGITNRLDTDSDGDGCADALEGSETVRYTQIYPLTFATTSLRGQIKVLGNGVTAGTPSQVISTVAAANGVPLLVNNAINNTGGVAGVADNTDGTADIGQGIGTSQNSGSRDTECDRCFRPATNPGVGGLATNHGITALSRAGANNGNWPMKITGAYTALDAKTKGFVLNRLTTVQVNAITNPVVGMMVYDTTVNCLKIYDNTNAWRCFSTQTCDNFNQ
jgi:hypothetical protein